MTLAGVRRRGFLVAVGLLLAVVAVVVLVWATRVDDRPPAPLTLRWAGSEGHPSCEHLPSREVVVATFALEGTPSRAGTLTVTVTVHADEDTSRPVGSATRTVQVDGTDPTTLQITLPVRRPPFVDIDGEAACSVQLGGELAGETVLS